MVAWGEVPDPGDPHRTLDPYDCWSCCTRDGKWDELERASRGCCRPDLPPVKWDVDPTRLAWHLGRAPSLDTIREIGPVAARKHDEPGEDPEEGCPGGWRYARFGYLVQRYARRRTRDGARVPSPNFDRIALANPVLADAVQYFEHEQERCIAHAERKSAEESRRQTEARRRQA